jgi:hypothetical protein
VFTIFHRKEIVGWLARSKKSKEWHKQNLKAFKEGKCSLVLRYRNSETDFSKILLGFDEITTETEEVWLVEGLFDKSNIDNLYNLYVLDKVKCCATFGSKVSRDQINLLKETGVKRIKLMYDAGTLEQNKKYGTELSKRFDVKICIFDNEDIDAGCATKQYVDDVISKEQDILKYYRTSGIRFGSLKIK